MADEGHDNIPQDAFPLQTMKALRAEGITTLQRLAQLSAVELLAVHRIGRKAVVAIGGLLHSHGLKLKDSEVMLSSALHRNVRTVLASHIVNESDLSRATDEVVACVERYWNSARDKSVSAPDQASPGPQE